MTYEIHRKYADIRIQQVDKELNLIKDSQTGKQNWACVRMGITVVYVIKRERKN
jgi:hypothetical protein